MTSPCWICGAPATTGEHMAKRTDLLAVIPTGKILIHSAGRDQVRVQGPNSKALKYEKSLCNPCNSARTAPHDLAWQKFSEIARHRAHDIQTRDGLRLPTTFGPAWREIMFGVHLFMAKQLGCLLVEEGNSTGVVQLADGILNNRSVPGLQMMFHHFEKTPQIHRSGITAMPRWGTVFKFYAVESFAVASIYSPIWRNSEKFDTWNPATGGKWLTFTALPPKNQVSSSRWWTWPARCIS